MPNRRAAALSVAHLEASCSIVYFDGPKMHVTNVLAANHFLRRDYRQGWAI
jgi:hypothetical protein